MQFLSGRRAFVTGGGSGIGGAVVAALARAGAETAVGGRRLDRLEAAAADARAQGSGAIAVQVDVTSSDSVDAAFSRASRELGPVDILVNGAGVAPSALLTKTSDEQWRVAIETNLSGAFYCMRRALPAMLERGWGRVVSVASIAGKVGHPYVSAYAASKHGLLGLTRSAALEVAAQGVTVNAVCPGYVDTPMTDASVERLAEHTDHEPEKIRGRLEAMSPQHRLYTAEEVAALVLYLMSEEARGINGQALSLDGGSTV